MDDSEHQERRKHYRLRYPPAERPTLQIEDRSYAVADLSEGGARVLLTADWEGPREQPFQAILSFRNGETVPVEGAVLRSEQRELILTFSQGVSFHHMMAEQRRIRQKYPMYQRGK